LDPDNASPAEAAEDQRPKKQEQAPRSVPKSKGSESFLDPDNALPTEAAEDHMPEGRNRGPTTSASRNKIKDVSPLLYMESLVLRETAGPLQSDPTAPRAGVEVPKSRSPEPILTPDNVLPTAASVDHAPERLSQRQAEPALCSKIENVSPLLHKEPSVTYPVTQEETTNQAKDGHVLRTAQQETTADVIQFSLVTQR
jgi:hypothetical protein